MGLCLQRGPMEVYVNFAISKWTCQKSLFNLWFEGNKFSNFLILVPSAPNGGEHNFSILNRDERCWGNWYKNRFEYYVTLKFCSQIISSDNEISDIRVRSM